MSRFGAAQSAGDVASAIQRYMDRQALLDYRSQILREEGKVLNEIERTSIWNFWKRDRLWKELNRLNERYEGAKDAYDALAKSHGM